MPRYSSLYGTDITDTQSVRGVDLHCGARAVDQFLERAGAEHNQSDVAHARANERVEEAALIRERHSQRMTRLTARAGSDPGAKTWTLNHERTRHSRCFFKVARVSDTGWRSAEQTR